LADFPNPLRPPSKDPLFWDEPRSHIGRCNTTLLKVREFSTTFDRAIGLVAFCLPKYKSVHYLSSETSMSPQTSPGFVLILPNQINLGKAWDSHEKQFVFTHGLQQPAGSPNKDNFLPV